MALDLFSPGWPFTEPAVTFAFVSIAIISLMLFSWWLILRCYRHVPHGRVLVFTDDERLRDGEDPVVLRSGGHFISPFPGHVHELDLLPHAVELDTGVRLDGAAHSRRTCHVHAVLSARIGDDPSALALASVRLLDQTDSWIDERVAASR